MMIIIILIKMYCDMLLKDNGDDIKLTVIKLIELVLN